MIVPSADAARASTVLADFGRTSGSIRKQHSLWLEPLQTNSGAMDTYHSQ
jgi:hypothetical protein